MKECIERLIGVRELLSMIGTITLVSACASLSTLAMDLPDPCEYPERPGASGLYEGQIDFLLRTYYPVSYLDEEKKQWLLSRFRDIQSRDEQALIDRFDQLEAFEQECLNRIFVTDEVLDGRFLVLQDNDADGVPDYRINNTGEFIENDSDADNDGLDNTLDVNPFDESESTMSDIDGDGIADHLDWSNAKLYDMTPKSQESQRRLHEDFGILLVEGNESFHPDSVDVIEDVMYRTLAASASIFREKSAIKYIFSAKGAYIGNNHDILGEVPAGLQRMYLYKPMFDYLDDNESRIAAYLTMLHEAVHGLQYAMDFPDNLPSLRRRNVHEVAPNFVAELNALQWQIDMAEPAQPKTLIYHGFTFNEVEHTAFKQTYGQDELAIPIAELEELYYSDVVPDARYGIVNAYALQNMWEWHAEYVTASVFNRIYQAAERLLSVEDYNAIRACSDEKLLQLYSADYTYQLDQIDPEIMRELELRYPISDNDLRYLASEYLIEPFHDCASG